MDQITFVPSSAGVQNDPLGASSKIQKIKNSSATNVFQANALKNLSKNAASSSVIKESRDESFGDYKDPFEKESRDFINNQLDQRSTIKSKDEFSR